MWFDNVIWKFDFTLLKCEAGAIRASKDDTVKQKKPCVLAGRGGRRDEPRDRSWAVSFLFVSRGVA